MIGRTWYVLVLLLCLPSSVLAFVTPPARAVSKAPTQPPHYRKTDVLPRGGRETRVAAASESTGSDDQAVSDEMNQFHTSLTEAEVCGNVLQLAHPPRGFVQNATEGKIFVRDCFVELWNTIETDPRRADFIITGFPKIGKSYFGLFVLHKLRKKGETVVFQVGDLGWFRFSNDGVEHDRSTKSDSSKWFLDPTVWLLCDPSEGNAVRAGSRCRKTVAFASHDHHMFADMQNAGTGSANVEYMPKWTLGELLECRKRVYPDFPEADVRATFNIIDGCAWIDGCAGPVFDSLSPQQWLAEVKFLEAHMSYFDKEVIRWENRGPDDEYG